MHVSVGLQTAKALDKAIRITDVQLEEKRGGKSGDYVRGTTG